MTLEQAMEHGEMVSYQQAEHEISRHGISMDEFTADHGSASEYASRVVMEWLGY